MKFSIVTPSFNMDPWIGRAIESVISQEGDFEIEYILSDGGSTDRTGAILEDSRARLTRGEWPVRCQALTMTSFSAKDEGTFDAINKGFARATGAIYTWADADNTYDPGALQAVAKTFETFPDVMWVHAVTDGMNDRWEKTARGTCRIYRQDWLRLGIYSQEAYATAQNGMFWRSELWKKAGPIPTTFRISGDYWLWIRMAEHAPLWALNVAIGSFMRREGQLHTSASFKAERWQARPHRSLSAWKARVFFSLQSRLGKRFEKVFVRLYPIFFTREPHPGYIDIVDGLPVKKTPQSYIC